MKICFCVLFALLFVSPAQARLDSKGPKQMARARIMVMVISGENVSTSKTALARKAGAILESHMHADLVSKEEAFVHGGASFQTMLQDCRGIAACYSRLVGSVDARYLVVISARAVNDIVVLGTRMIDLDQQIVSGKAIGRIKADQVLLDNLEAQLKKTVPEILWDPYGSISLRVQQSGAQVRLNGAPLGSSPLQTIEKLLPGEYTIGITLDGHVHEESKFTVVKNQELQLKFNLKPKSGPFSQWWFWTSLAALAVSGIGAGIFLSQQGPPVFCSSPDPNACP